MKIAGSSQLCLDRKLKMLSDVVKDVYLIFMTKGNIKIEILLWREPFLEAERHNYLYTNSGNVILRRKKQLCT